MSLSITLSNSLTGGFIDDIVVSEDALSLRRSLSGLEISEVVIPKSFVENASLNDYDKMNVFIGEDLTYFIARINHINYDNEDAVIEFTLDYEMYQRRERLSDNSVTMIDYTVDNYEDWAIILVGEHIVLSTEGRLYSDQLIRQVMRKTQFKVVYNRNDKIVYLIENLSEPYKFRLDDDYIEPDSLKIEFADDVLNEIELIFKDDETGEEFSQTYFRDSSDNTVTVRPTDIRFVNDVEYVEADKWNDIEYADSLFRKSSYSNRIEFKIPYNKTADFIPFDEIMGRKVDVVIPKSTRLENGMMTSSDVLLKSIVSEIEYENGFMVIILGLSQGKLTSVLSSDD